MSGQGRGRGEFPKIAKLEDEPGPSGRHPASQKSTTSSSDENGEGEKTIRGRGGFRQIELHTIPAKVTQVKAQATPQHQPIDVVANFVKISAMPSKNVYQYRVDYEPNVESLQLRRRVFNEATESLFNRKVIFDGVSDARSGIQTPDESMEFSVNHPSDASRIIRMKLRRVGIVTGSFEMIRVYNMHMKGFLRALGFYQISTTGAYIHPSLYNTIGRNNNLLTVRGFKTGANVHENNQILMNLESCHKLMQRQNVLQQLMEMRQRGGGGDFMAAMRSRLVGKLVVAGYTKQVYRIEDINFQLNPTSTFRDDRENRDISYLEYYKKRYDVQILDLQQPLLLVTPNNRRRGEREEENKKDIYVIPELCNIAGLTDEQKNEMSLRIDLIKASQIDPNERVNHMVKFLTELHNNSTVKEMLNNWGYTYEQRPISIKARILEKQKIGMGRSANLPPDKWNVTVDHMASFDQPLQRECVAKAPAFPKLVVVVPRSEFNNQGAIITKLKTGFDKVGLVPQAVDFARMGEGDAPNHYVQYLRNLPSDTTAALVIMTRQNKDRYDAIKKLATTERGLITQVVTSKLMMDDRKAGGAAVKIGVQVAAKLGGEPWYIFIPLPNTMICGYDTYHDTAQAGRSFGAFVASMNAKFSRWFSKADQHDVIDELSSHMAQNLSVSLTRYHEINKRYPERLFIYRDGVGDGQIEHVYNVELKRVKQAVRDKSPDIKIAFIIVNKRIGARFYWRQNNEFKNPPPGSVIDDVVTRKERYDFYLISQSTRNGTVTPTYYNIIEDESGLDAGKHQTLAFKLCFLYYNWTGTVRVPAPCQYAHKLALLCGENLHRTPNANLDDKLHFL